MNDVLVVDDDPDMAAFLARILEKEGMRAAIALDGDQAMARVAQELPELVLLDVMLPGKSGFDLCAQLKSNPATAMLPVVLVTALDDHASRVRGLEAGADDFLSKPVKREELIARVKNLRRLHETRRELEARRLAAEVQRKEALRKAFTRYVSPRLADRIIADIGEDGTPFEGAPLRLNVVALFADLRGFTQLTESAGVEAVISMLNEYFAVVTEAAYRHDGTIFGMAGDNLLIGFNVPFPQPDACERALRAGHDMIVSFAPVLERWIERGGLPTGIGVGIASGEAILGNVGSPHYMSHTIIGDAVNIAARLVQMAQPGELLMSDEVHRGAGRAGVNRIEARGNIALRGKSEPIAVYALRP